MSKIRMKRVLVTGSAHGIGLAIARRFAAGGAEVVLTDVNTAGLEAAREELSATGARTRAYTLDVTDPENVEAVRDQLHHEAGKLDILVNNAGVVFGGAFRDVPLEKHRLTYRVNVEGVCNMTYAFLDDLVDAPRGHLVNIASLSGFIGLPGGATYASSKWAVIGFSESIRLELKKLGHRNVDVTSVCPSFVNTGLFQGAKPPKTASLLDAEAIAEKVIEAVERRQVWVLEPWIAKITPFLKNCLPTSVSDVLADFFGATSSMDRWTGHAAPAESAPAGAAKPHRSAAA